MALYVTGISTPEVHPEFPPRLGTLTALDNWFIGGEPLALVHLYMSAETLEKAVVSKMCRDRNVSEDELAGQLEVPKKALWPHVRREVIFRGDTTSYDEAKSASDGLEHGSMPLGQIHETSRGVVLTAFGYLREAILDVMGVPDPARGLPLGDKYREPFDAQSLRKVVRGTFVLPEGSDDLAAESEEYPLLRWSSSIKSLRRDEAGFHPSFEESLKVICAEGVQSRTEAFEVHGRPSPGSEPVRLDLKVEVTGDAPPSDDQGSRHRTAASDSLHRTWEHQLRVRKAHGLRPRCYGDGHRRSSAARAPFPRENRPRPPC